ncbi:MAG TPA: signal peptidase I [Mycobacteriales bacterium]|nr:signal peptidase I [Mycobacteriales bacterium]
MTEPPVESDAAIASDPTVEPDESPAADPADSAPQEGTRSEHGSFWRELPFLVLIALVLALLIKTFLVQAFYIPSASMENTLQGGGDFTNSAATGSHPFDRVLVNKLVYDFRSPRRGEIVVFKKPPGWPNESSYSPPGNPVLRFFHGIGSAIGIAPSGGSDFIKRVIGIGGDTVSCTNDVLSVNGHVLHEPYLYPGSRPCSDANFDNRSKVVPKGELFVMGDHRGDSDDSRVNGPVPVKDVVGRAFVVIWPVSDWRTLPIPSTFKQAGLAAAGSPLTPVVGGAALVAPVGLIRRRRKRSRTLAVDGCSGTDRTA